MARTRSRNAEDRAADALTDLLMRTPLWAGPVIAVSAYVTLRFILPPLIDSAGKPLGTELAGLSRSVAPLVGFIVLGIWAIAGIKKLSRRWLLNSRSDIESLRAMSWQEFEQLVGEAYRRQGYGVEESGGGGADGGVDLVLRKAGETTLVQCKQWKTWKVGVKIVRELYGIMAAEQAARAIVVTCGRFTQEAGTFAAGKPLELVDGPALWELVRDVQTRAYPGPVPFGQPTGTGMARPSAPPGVAPATAAPTCPRCGSSMVLRTARKGPNAGSQFYGCSRFPECRGIRSRTSGNGL